METGSFMNRYPQRYNHLRLEGIGFMRGSLT
jgi:hypothetical protein